MAYPNGSASLRFEGATDVDPGRVIRWFVEREQFFECLGKHSRGDEKVNSENASIVPVRACDNQDMRRVRICCDCGCVSEQPEHASPKNLSKNPLLLLILNFSKLL
jgi:hypothetical protein